MGVEIQRWGCQNAGQFRYYISDLIKEWIVTFTFEKFKKNLLRNYLVKIIMGTVVSY